MNYQLEKFPFDANLLKKILRSDIFLYTVIMLFVIKMLITVVSVNFPENFFFAQIHKGSLNQLVNQTRGELGLHPLAENKQLDEAAELKAQDMIINHYFSHTSPSGVSPWHWFSQAGYSYHYAGENLAVGFYDSIEVYNAWINSSSHKENIINPNYTEIGTAILSGFGENSNIVVVQLFGSAQKIKSKKTPAASPVNNVPEIESPKVEIVQKTEFTEKVLAETIEREIKPSQENIQNPEWIPVILTYPYERVVQTVIYGTSLCTIGVLLFLLLFTMHPLHKLPLENNVAFRSMIITALLSASLLIDKEIIVSHLLS